ncbi:hypothetical protein IKG33_01260 [Candidatus Saccharibacteria bacterium]|nr:hypothetical protein [Candidatus Saccharibacteria bacterium]
MNLFEKANNVFRRNRNATEWDSLENVPFGQNPNEPDSNTSSEKPSNSNTIEKLDDLSLSRQQCKLVKILSSGNLDILDQSDVNMNTQELSYVINHINNGTIKTEDFQYIVSQIKGPQDVKSPDQILARLSDQKHEKRILATMTGLGFNHPNQVQPSQIQTFYNQFPEPSDFDTQAESFLEDIKTYNSPQKYKEYVKAMNNFKHVLYGKKQEYWDSSKDLISLALQQSNKMSPNQQLDMQPNNLSPEEILELTKIDGDALLFQGQERHLTPNDLKRMNLGPRYETILDNVTIGLSDTFRVGSRDAVIGYVFTPDGQFKARSYYRSNSAGTWRYLPDYIKDENGIVSWYGKAYSEESLTLPFELQQTLNNIAKSGPIETNGINPQLAFLGTAKKYTDEEYDTHQKAETLSGDYYKEINKNPAFDFSDFSYQRMPPELLRIPGSNAPDFSNELGSFNIDHPLYGDVKTRLFQSFNQKLRYLMCERYSEDGDINAWIGNIETNAPITSTGLRSNWVFAGDFITPLYEHDSMTDGYGDTSDAKNGYQSMWKNYLSETPIIQSYMHDVHHQNLHQFEKQSKIVA